MTDPLITRWRAAFSDAVQRQEDAERLKQAATQGRLADWTAALTSCVVATCREMGWVASAIGHKASLLPVDQSEYLAVDVMAFGDGAKRWRFPLAVAELENSQSPDRIAYSLWKVLSVRADLRIVFCYRRKPEDGPALVRFLESEVVLISAKNYANGLRWVYLDVGKFGGLAETMDEAIRYPIVTAHDGSETAPCVLAGPTCDSADVMYEKTPYPLPLSLTIGDEVLIEGTGAYTTTYSAVAFNGFEPLRSYVI